MSANIVCYLLSIAFEMYKISLAHSLIYRDGNSIGKIERAASLLHRHTQGLFKSFFKQILGKSLCFLSENEKNALCVLHLGVNVACFFGKEPHLLTLVLFKKFSEIFVIVYFKLVPIIKARVFKFFIVNCKAHRLYKMQSCACYCAGSCDISRVLRDLGLVKNNVDFAHHQSPFRWCFSIILFFALYFKRIFKEFNKIYK